MGMMKKLLLLVLLVSQFAFGVTANKVWRIPSGATLPAWGPVNLADTTNAVTGSLPAASLESNANFGGNAVQENGKNLVVSGGNAATSLAVVTGSSTGNAGTTCSGFVGVGLTCNFNSSAGSRLAFLFTNSFASTPVCVSTLTSGSGGCAINDVSVSHVYLDSACSSTGSVICFGPR